MQTFLPYQSFVRSAAVLDRHRLGKQRVENLQIMNALLGGEGWKNHPVVKMWAGYEWALLQYQRIICAEWTARGYKDTCWVKTQDLFYDRHIRQLPDRMPHWLGDPKFHIAYRSNLIRKDATFYQPLWPDLPDDLPYIYPDPIKEINNDHASTRS